jgi:hypothetical protein
MRTSDKSRNGPLSDLCAEVMPAVVSGRLGGDYRAWCLFSTRFRFCILRPNRKEKIAKSEGAFTPLAPTPVTTSRSADPGEEAPNMDQVSIRRRKTGWPKSSPRRRPRPFCQTNDHSIVICAIWSTLTLEQRTMAPRETEEKIREVGRVKEDHWERFDRLQRNLRPFLRGKPKRAPVERFRSYSDLEHGRNDSSPRR